MLILKRGDEDEPIYCELKAVDFSQLDKYPYWALSYCWGDDDPTNPILVSDRTFSRTDSANKRGLIKLVAQQARPKEFFIRSNLYKALKRLRTRRKDVWLWVDALCINQKDSNEKTHQLQKMLEIYGKARNVCIWIGENEADDKSLLAMDMIADCVNLKVLDRLVSPEVAYDKAVESWVAFADLLRRPWFTRRWVVQEVACARSVTIQCGQRDVNWIDFADAIDLFMSKLDRIRTLYEASDRSRFDPDALKYVESLGAKAMVRTTNNVFRKSDDNKILERLFTIESLVMNLLTFESSNPRDTVYALLGIAKDGPLGDFRGARPDSCTVEPLVADYNKQPFDVYTDFVQYCIQTTDSLDIICRHWALPVYEERLALTRGARELLEPLRMPSWIGLLEDSAFGPPSRYTGRKNADSLVGEPGRRIYNASRGMAARARFGKLSESNVAIDTAAANAAVHAHVGTKSIFDGILYAFGIKIGQISEISSRIVDATIPKECLTMGGWIEGYPTDRVPDKLWRTLVADRGPDGKNPPTWYRRACLYGLSQASPDGDINTGQLARDRSQPESLVEYLRRVQSVIWSRKFFACTEGPDRAKHVFGLGPRRAEKGDLICILFGCSVPVTLRRHDSESCYELIGECYVHGKMEGEAFAGMDQDAIEKEKTEFNIR